MSLPGATVTVLFGPAVGEGPRDHDSAGAQVERVAAMQAGLVADEPASPGLYFAHPLADPKMVSSTNPNSEESGKGNVDWEASVRRELPSCRSP